MDILKYNCWVAKVQEDQKFRTLLEKQASLETTRTGERKLYS